MADTCLLTSGLSRTIPPLKSVLTGPGATTLAAIRRGASSLALPGTPVIVLGMGRSGTLYLSNFLGANCPGDSSARNLR